MPISEKEIERLRGWVGKRETKRDVISLREVRALHATLDLETRIPRNGDGLTPGWHWMYFNEMAPRREIRRDGHPAPSGIMPPVPLPRRMWAGNRIEVRKKLPVGVEAKRRSEVRSLDYKSGKTGDLVFVTIRHTIAGPDGTAFVEDQDVVYRQDQPPGTPRPQPPAAPEDPVWLRMVKPDPVLLFRYSALTLNSHRIHYDLPYARDVEGYDDLVVHGPLQATMLINLAMAQNPKRRFARFSFRAFSPLFADAPFMLAGSPEGDAGCHVWTMDEQGGLAMECRAEFA